MLSMLEKYDGKIKWKPWIKDIEFILYSKITSYNWNVSDPKLHFYFHEATNDCK